MVRGTLAKNELKPESVYIYAIANKGKPVMMMVLVLELTRAHMDIQVNLTVRYLATLQYIGKSDT